MTDIRLKQTITPVEAITLDFLLLDTGQLDTREELETAVRVALGTDAMAGPNDILPDPDSTDRRGWWGDMDAAEIWGGWPIGCKNWLLTRAKITDAPSVEGSTLERAHNYTQQALQPFVDIRLATSVDVRATRSELERIDVTATLYRESMEDIALRYQILWQEPDFIDEAQFISPPPPSLQPRAANLAGGIPVLGSPLMRQRHVLHASNLADSTPTFSSVSLATPPNIGPSINADTGYYIITGTDGVSVEDLSPGVLSDGAPVVGIPPINRKSGITAANLSSGTPTLGTPVFNPSASGSTIFGANLVVAAPTIVKPVMSVSSGITTIWTPSNSLSDNNSDYDTSIRMVCTGIGSFGNQLRITFRPNDAGNDDTNISHLSVGKWTGTAGTTDTTATPVEIKFGGASGLTRAAGTGAITSDWADVSSLGLTAGNSIVIIFDGNTTCGYLSSSDNANASTELYAGQTWNVTSTGAGTSGTWDCGIQSIEKQ